MLDFSAEESECLRASRPPETFRAFTIHRLTPVTPSLAHGVIHRSVGMPAHGSDPILEWWYADGSRNERAPRICGGAARIVLSELGCTARACGPGIHQLERRGAGFDQRELGRDELTIGRGRRHRIEAHIRSESVTDSH